MTSLTIDELKKLAKAKKIDGFGSMSRQQLESIFIILSGSTPVPGPALRPKILTSISAP